MDTAGRIWKGDSVQLAAAKVGLSHLIVYDPEALTLKAPVLGTLSAMEILQQQWFAV